MSSVFCFYIQFIQSKHLSFHFYNMAPSYCYVSPRQCRLCIDLNLSSRYINYIYTVYIYMHIYIYMHVCVFNDSCDLYRIKEISIERVQRKATQTGGNKVMQIVQIANLKRRDVAGSINWWEKSKSTLANTKQWKSAQKGLSLVPHVSRLTKDNMLKKKKKRNKGVNDLIEPTAHCYVLLQHKLVRYFQNFFMSFSAFFTQRRRSQQLGPLSQGLGCWVACRGCCVG